MSSSSVITVGIAGGSGAGKTTLARRLYEELGEAEHVCYLFHDSYYKDISHKTFEERSQTNFDHPDSLDTDLLLQHLKELKAGAACNIPTYDFTTHSRNASSLGMEAKKIIIVEGILLFTHPELTQEMDVKVFVDADSDIRLMRRIVRDTQERGRSVEEVLDQYHTTVRPMHEEWVEPSKSVADLIVHSSGDSLDVAIQVLKHHVLACVREET